MNRVETQTFINAFLKMRELLTDQQASIVVDLYPTLKDNSELIKAGTRIDWKGEVKKAAVDLWDMVENNPDNAPSLWESLDYKDGYRTIPATITVTTAFAINECGWWNGVLYKSLIANNVWTPDVYPAGWELVG